MRRASADVPVQATRSVLTPGNAAKSASSRASIAARPAKLSLPEFWFAQRMSRSRREGASRIMASDTLQMGGVIELRDDPLAVFVHRQFREARTVKLEGNVVPVVLSESEPPLHQPLNRQAMRHDQQVIG